MLRIMCLNYLKGPYTYCDRTGCNRQQQGSAGAFVVIHLADFFPALMLLFCRFKKSRNTYQLLVDILRTITRFTSF